MYHIHFEIKGNIKDSKAAYSKRSRMSSIGVKSVAVCLRPGRPGNYTRMPGRDNRFYSSLQRPHRLWRQSSFLFNGYRGAFLEVKRHGREAPYLPPSAQVKSDYSYTCTPPYAFITCTDTISPLSFNLTINKRILDLNLFKPNDIYICRTPALTSRRYILNIYSTNIHTEYFKHAA